MKQRIENVIETLKRAPPPKYVGEIIVLPLLMETWEMNIHQKQVTHSDFPQIRLEAIAMHDGTTKRIHWAMTVV